MYCVKVKHFPDSVQYQIYEKSGKREVDDENLEHSYLFEKTNKSKKKLKCNPFNDEKLEWMEEIKESAGEQSIYSSVSRSKKAIYDIGRCNQWDWFLTLTLNPAVVDRYDYKACNRKLSVWLNNMKKKCPDMKYLIIPEQHEKGGWHFHGLFANIDGLGFENTGKLSKRGQEIFHCSSYKYGWQEAVKVYDHFGAVAYLSKYITKNLCQMLKGKKRYWFSKNCDLPIVEEFELSTSLENIIEQIDVTDARMVTKDGFVSVTYIDKRIGGIYERNQEKL